MVRPQFAHHGGGKVGRSEGLSYHVEQLRARGIATEVAHLHVGDALWVARSKCAARAPVNYRNRIGHLRTDAKIRLPVVHQLC